MKPTDVFLDDQVAFITGAANGIGEVHAFAPDMIATKGLQSFSMYRAKPVALPVIITFTCNAWAALKKLAVLPSFWRQKCLPT